MLITFIFLAALFICLLALNLVRKPPFVNFLVDLPNERSLHFRPTPKVGGVGYAITLAIFAFFQNYYPAAEVGSLNLLFWAYLTLFIVSLANDMRDVSPILRLPTHFAVVALWLHFDVPTTQLVNSISNQMETWIFSCLLILAITWALNLYNFMDGADGLVGGMTLVGFGAYSIVLFAVGDMVLASLTIAICGATIGFLLLNWAPAKLFLGDSGSIPLGYLAAAIGWVGFSKGYWAVTLPLSLFAMFWIDATLTLLRRLLRREKIWKPHRDHWYQKAILGRNSHRKVALIHLGCNSLIAIPAIVSATVTILDTPLMHAVTMGIALITTNAFGVWAEKQLKNV